MACPISGLVQFLIVLVLLLLACHSMVTRALTVNFKPNNVTVYMSESVAVRYNISDTGGTEKECLLYSENPHVAFLEGNDIILNSSRPSGVFNISGNFLGQTIVSCKNKLTNQRLENADSVEVKCLRKQRVIDRIFTGSAATLVAIIYINFGCVVQWGELRNLIKRPVGPAIGFIGQFVVMPVTSYVVGWLLFPDEPEMRLGFFFTGVSPAGGASNIWTAILDGNIDLSVLMTTISTCAAFGMMPLWIFTLGKTIFQDADLEVPYTQITTYVLALIIPLSIGYLINRYLKRFGAFMARILKGFSSLLILFIIVFAIVTNLYLFELFSWRIVVAGMGLPWLGYMLGWILAKVLRQPAPDCLAIAIETGIQNTGIAIFLLRFALEPLHADLTTVAPVSVAIMTPFPLMLLYLYKKIKQRMNPHEKLRLPKEEEIRKKDNNNLTMISPVERKDSSSPMSHPDV